MRLHPLLRWFLFEAMLGTPLLYPNFVTAGEVDRDVPAKIDVNASYLFYMHGQAIEEGGRRARDYNYSGILKALARRGFVVIGEERGRVRNVIYARKVVEQVNKLLEAGVPANKITVAGHSKGGMIAMIAMTMLKQPDIAYVNFAGCIKQTGREQAFLRFAKRRAARARGKLLSAYDKNDRIAGSCRVALDEMTHARVKERVLDVGGGHELFYTPNPKWLGILEAWAERRG